MRGNSHVRFGEGGGETRRPQGWKVRPAPTLRSGNFLYVSLRLLLDLEKSVIDLADELQVGRFFHNVNVGQVMGIEINEFAYELAQTTIWIGFIQWHVQNGLGFPTEPILKPLHNIRHMDAILAHDADGKPVEPEWPAADVIVGNPPFLGVSRMRTELGDIYVDSLFSLYDGRVPHGVDLVCYWFEKARSMVERGQITRSRLLATQAIRTGASRRILERIKATGDLFWAQSDREWILEGAAVRVSMVGFDNGTERFRELDGISVPAVNADLKSGIDLTLARPLVENRDICFMGPSAKGPLEITATTAEEMLRAPLNPNGHSNSDVVRPVLNAMDIVQHPRHMWTIDFGLLAEEDAAQYEMPFEYARKVVYPVRSRNRRAAYAKRWWQYAEARPGMRAALTAKPRFIATPGVSKHRIFVWVHSQVLCNQKNMVFARADNYFFGLLHSKAHEVWALTNGARHGVGDDPTYNIKKCFETFAFPTAPGTETQDDPLVIAIVEAAADLVKLRDAWLNPPGASESDLKKRTLTNLYNQRPTWLDNAHRRLDEAVFAAYGWPANLSDDEILARLLALNLERVATQGEAAAGERPQDDDE